MKNKIITTFLFLLFSHVMWGNNRLDSILHILDETLTIHHIFKEEKEDRIRGLNEKLSEAGSEEEIYQWNLSLFAAYKTYICDSAIHYLNQNIVVAKKMADNSKLNQTHLLLSSLLNSSGMFAEALDILSQLNKQEFTPENLTDYYLAYYQTYNEIAFHTQDIISAEKYKQRAKRYKDSLLTVIDPETDLYFFHLETKYRNSENYHEALKVNDSRLQKVRFGTPEYALISFQRSLILSRQGNQDEEMYFLALSALSDIQSSIKDHASLWMLAQYLYKKGDIERAYRYIRFSWNETTFYNARLRSIQSAHILSLIDKTYQGIVIKQNQQLRNYVVLTSILAFLLIAAIFYIYKQMKRLSFARNNLQQANQQLVTLNKELQDMNNCLQITNTDLSESNHIKEEYIGRFIKLCSTYIDKLDGYRRMVNKKIGQGQTDELATITRSPAALDKELKELYHNFDTTFLQLFPDFIGQFNALLIEDEPILPKKGELLNTELRIYALIRLGITDSIQISEFLRYSLNTIYNYRAKVRNKARGARDDFESLVMKIR